MKISINIPTFHRAGEMDTFNLLPKAFYWIHEFEIEKYKNKHKGIKIKKLPNELKGNIAIVRNYILKNQDGEMDVILLIDDDVKNISYWEKNKRVKINNISRFIIHPF